MIWEEPIIKTMGKSVKSILSDGLKEIKSSEISYDNWPKKRIIVKEKIEEWSQRDFALYISNKFRDKFSKPCDFSINGISTYFGRIKLYLKDSISVCSNSVLKEYVDYFFDNHLEKILSIGSKFWLRKLCDEIILKEFDSVYKSGIIEIKNKIEENKNSPFISLNDVDSCYCMLSFDAVIANYGILIALSYLIEEHKFSEEKASDKVCKILDRLFKNKDTIKKILEKTKKFDKIIGFVSPNYNKFLDFCKEKYPSLSLDLNCE